MKQWFIVRTATEAADRSEGEALVAAARSKGLVGVTAGEHGAYGQAEDGGKGVTMSSGRRVRLPLCHANEGVAKWF